MSETTLNSPPALGVQSYPILEFDSASEAKIEPSRYHKPIDIAPHCVLCFFHDVIARLREENQVTQIATQRSEMGIHPVYEIQVEGKRLAVFHPGIGASLSVGLTEEIIALGCRKFIVCGGAGVLVRGIACGHVIVPEAAVRDEGTSYHYMAPSREAYPSPQALEVIEQTLRERGFEYMKAKTWTTDAFYRETQAKIDLRKSEGCLTVEMEASALFALAAFRGVTLGQILYGGDDLSGSTWDPREWHTRSARETLFWLAAEACLKL